MPAICRFPGLPRAGWAGCMVLIGWLGAVCLGQHVHEQSPINYSKAPTDNVVSRLQAQIDSGEVTLKHDQERGYLPAVLAALEVPQSSQALVFSKTSLQVTKISPRRPRAIYFNEDVYVA